MSQFYETETIISFHGCVTDRSDKTKKICIITQSNSILKRSDLRFHPLLLVVMRVFWKLRLPASNPILSDPYVSLIETSSSLILQDCCWTIASISIFLGRTKLFDATVFSRTQYSGHPIARRYYKSHVY